MPSPYHKCAKDGCEKLVNSRATYCRNHFRTPEILENLARIGRERRQTEETKRKIAKAHTKPIKQRFWSKVNIKGLFDCWEWMAYKDKKGYGRCNFFTDTLVHRIAWILIYGKIPKGLFVCHHCDNPSCVNPAHLFLGTHKDNMNDRDKKGRQSHSMGKKGSKHNFARFTEEQIIAIRVLYQAGIRQYEIAKMYNVDKDHICLIVHRKIWTHI